jgi:uncharacterized membrane protein
VSVAALSLRSSEREEIFVSRIMLPVFFLLLILFPFLFSELMLTSMMKLHLSPETGLMLVIAMFVGGLVNIPVKAMVRDRDVFVDPLAVYGLDGLWPQLRRVRRTTIVAANLGGCVIPAGLALYEFAYLAGAGAAPFAATAAGSLINIVVCYSIARPVPNVGIVMPGFVSPLTAAALALILAPGVTAPAAFVIGVTGPLVGADLLHLKDLEAGEAGAISIGGAGTFDGIALSGIVAAYLA